MFQREQWLVKEPKRVEKKETLSHYRAETCVTTDLI
jgi:hypothetical protein